MVLQDAHLYFFGFRLHLQFGITHFRSIEMVENVSLKFCFTPPASPLGKHVECVEDVFCFCGLTSCGIVVDRSESVDEGDGVCWK